MKITTHLIFAHRLENSRNGNPRYDVATADGTYRTASNSAAGYVLSSGMMDRPVTLTLNPRKQIVKVELQD